MSILGRFKEAFPDGQFVKTDSYTGLEFGPNVRIYIGPSRANILKNRVAELPNGNVLQDYLDRHDFAPYEVRKNKFEYRIFVEHVDRVIEIIRYGSEREEEDVTESEIRQRTDIASTQILALVNARRGQGVFRANVELKESSCRITGVSNSQYLEASHIKPWKDSNDAEKLDGDNGLLLSPHIHLLFDRFFFTFEEDGNMRVSRRPDVDVRSTWAIPDSVHPIPFRSTQLDYLQWHQAEFNRLESETIKGHAE